MLTEARNSLMDPNMRMTDQRKTGKNIMNVVQQEAVHAFASAVGISANVT